MGNTITASAVKRADKATEDRLRQMGVLEGWQRVWLCAIRLENTCCYGRLMAFACLPLIDDLQRNFDLHHKTWEFQRAGDLSL